jgi:hypothetical protein
VTCPLSSRTGGLGPVHALAVLPCHPTNWRADSHQDSEQPFPSSSERHHGPDGLAPTLPAEAALARQEAHNASRRRHAGPRSPATRQPRPRRRPHPHPRRGTAAGRAPNRDDSPPSGRPPPEPPAAHPSRRGFSTAASRGRVIDELMGTPATAAPPGTRRRRQRDRPPRPPHHPRDAAREAHARSRSHTKDRGTNTAIALLGGML